MSESKNELQAVLDALLLEKEEDFEQFKAHVQSLSLEEKRKQGYTWNPVEVLSSGYTFGERAFVVVQRTKAIDEPHTFRAGKTVNFYSGQAGARHPERIGVINYVDKNKMKIILNAKDLPEWLNMGMLGVDLLFDERSYLEMEKAMKILMEAKGDRLAELRQIFLGKTEPRFYFPTELANLASLDGLNISQNEAAQH